MGNIHVKLFEIWTSGSRLRRRCRLLKKFTDGCTMDGLKTDGRTTNSQWTKTNHNSISDLSTHPQWSGMYVKSIISLHVGLHFFHFTLISNIRKKYLTV